MADRMCGKVLNPNDPPKDWEYCMREAGHSGGCA